MIIKRKNLIKKLPSIIKSINANLPDGSNLILAGGAVRSMFTNEEINDYDLYLVTNVTDNITYCDLLSDIIEKLSNASSLISCTDKSLMVRYNDSLINFVFFKKFISIDDIFDSFDFTCVMGAYNISTSKFYVSNDFLIDNISKTIRFNHNTSFPIMTLLRVKKYTDKGYSISRNEMLKICLRITELTISSYDDLKKHIGGMYGINIEKIFDVEKPFVMDEIISTISNLDIEYDMVSDAEVDFTPLLMLKLKLYNDKSLTYANFKDKLSNFKDKVLLIRNGILLGIVHKSLIENEKIKPHSGKFKVYKYIGYNETDNEYYSLRETSFKYKLGETILPNNKHNTGLFCGTLNTKKSFTYSTHNSRVLIELLVDPKDIKAVSSYYDHGRIGISNMEVNQFIFSKIINEEK